jgi:cobaltochelatase CobS
MAKKAKFRVKDLFGINVNDNATVIGFTKDPSNPYIRKADENYVFDKETVMALIFWYYFSKNDGLFLTGPTGSGKSSVVTQFLARLNIPCQRVTCHSRMEIPDLIGFQTIVKGETVFQDGPLTKAMRYGHVFIMDEMDLLDPSVAAGLNGVVEGEPLVLSENEGEIVYPQPGFRFVGTGNTNGLGDETGGYQGTLQQNIAFMDRMQVLEVDYLAPEVEIRILDKMLPKVPKALKEQFVSIANTFRGIYKGEDNSDLTQTLSSLEIPMSTRTLIRWADAYAKYVSNTTKDPAEVLHLTLDRAFANRLSPESKIAVHEYIDRLAEEL